MATVLLVDDDVDGTEPVARLLRRAGHHVACVPDGRQAVGEVINNAPDVILLDVMMPRMDGIAFLEVLRSDLRHTSVPVILLTGLADERRLARASELGVRRVFRKADYKLDELLAYINGIVPPEPERARQAG